MSSSLPSPPSQSAWCALPNPPSRSAWRALTATAALGLSKANLLAAAPDHPNSPSDRLDHALAFAIHRQDTPAFTAVLKQAILSATRDDPFIAARALNASLRNEDAYYLELLLRSGANPNALASSALNCPVPSDYPLLARAAFSNQSQAIKRLLSFGANPAALNASGQTPLIIASIAGSTEAASALINAGSPLDAIDRFQRAALHHALELPSGKDPLFTHTAPSESNLLSFAQPILDRAPIAIALLNAGASAQSLPRELCFDHSKQLPLLAIAIRIQHFDLFYALLRGGADASWLVNPAQSLYHPRKIDFLQSFLALAPRSNGMDGFVAQARMAASQFAASSAEASAPVARAQPESEPAPELGLTWDPAIAFGVSNASSPKDTSLLSPSGDYADPETRSPKPRSILSRSRR